MLVSRKLVRSTDRPIAVTVGRVAAAFMGLFVAPITARLLSVPDRGVLASMLAVTALSPVVFAIGLPLVVRRRYSSDRDDLSCVANSRLMALLSLAIAVPTSLIFVFTLYSGLEVPEKIAFVVAVAASMGSILVMIDVSLLVVRQKYLLIGVLQSVQAGVMALGAVSVAAFGVMSITSLMIVSAVSSVVGGALGDFLVGVPYTVRPRGVLSDAREGLRLAGSQVADSASARLDQVLIIPVAGSYAAGLYAIASTVASLPVTVGHAIAASSFNSFVVSDRDQRVRVVGQAVRSALIVGLLVALCLAVVSPLAVPLVFGEKFSPAVPSVMAALVGAALAVPAYVGSMALVAHRRGGIMTLAQVAGLASAVLALLALGPSFSALGAAMASSIGYGVTLTLVCIALGIVGRIWRLGWDDIKRIKVLLLSRDPVN